MQIAGCNSTSAPSCRSCSASGSCGSAGRVTITRVPRSGRFARDGSFMSHKSRFTAAMLC